MNTITDSDLVALSLLGRRVTGYQALSITGPLGETIGELLAQIPPQARIEGENAEALLARCGPAWKLWEYLADLRQAPDVTHLPILRVLDILGWMHGGGRSQERAVSPDAELPPG